MRGRRRSVPPAYLIAKVFRSDQAQAVVCRILHNMIDDADGICHADICCGKFYFSHGFVQDKELEVVPELKRRRIKTEPVMLGIRIFEIRIEIPDIG